jgi:hypothetical protein
MSVTRITLAEDQRRIFENDPVRNVEILDVIDRDGAEAVAVFVDDPRRPVNAVSVRFGSGPMHLSNVVDVHAGRISGLQDVIEALPRGAGRYEFVCPFWVAPALEQVFKTEMQGPISRYVLPEGYLSPHPSARQCVPFGGEDLDLVSFAFPRTVAEAPHRALVLRDTLVAVAVTTAMADGVAQIGIHVVEEHRGRGFGKGVASALAAALLAAGQIPTAVVSLGDEASVRLVEGLGLVQVETLVRVTGMSRLASGAPG